MKVHFLSIQILIDENRIYYDSENQNVFYTTLISSQIYIRKVWDPCLKCRLKFLDEKGSAKEVLQSLEDQ